MSDLDVAASNAADEPNAIVETVDAPNSADALDLPPAKSSIEALDRAFDKIEADTEPKSAQNRQPDGKFAKGKTEVKPTEPTDPLAAAAPQFDVNELAAFGLTKEALAAAAKSDPTFLADAKRRLTELTQGIEKHKTPAENWQRGQPFHERAAQAGRDVWDVFGQYVQMEDTLRNPQMRAQGFIALAQNIGVEPLALAHEIAQAAQGQQYQPAQPQQRSLSPEEIRALSRAESEAYYAERDAIQSINSFKADHPGYDQLQDRIGQLLENKDERLPQGVTGVPLLKAAYELAANEVRSLVSQLTPAEAAAQANNAAAQTPAVTTAQAVQPAQPDPITKAKATLSISGSPEGGSNPATRKIPGSSSAALDSAFARVGITNI